VGSLAWTAACQCSDPGPGATGGVTTVYIVRHAEKGEGEDPNLSEEGQLRALSLPQEIELPGLRAVYATETRRTRQTASAVASLAGVEVTRMPPTDYEGLKKRVNRYAGGAILVVGHSNTVPDMIAALGVAERVELTEGDYGDLFILSVERGAETTMQRRRFGDAPLRPSL
jgi:phosphohistidine phosphatase SixA